MRYLFLDDQMSDLSSDDQSSLPGKVEQDEPVSEPEEPKVDTSEIEDENQELAGNNRSQRYNNIRYILLSSDAERHLKIFNCITTT